jgi:hypothetical protein
MGTGASPSALLWLAFPQQLLQALSVERGGRLAVPVLMADLARARWSAAYLTRRF